MAYIVVLLRSEIKLYRPTAYLSGTHQKCKLAECVQIQKAFEQSRKREGRQSFGLKRIVYSTESQSEDLCAIYSSKTIGKAFKSTTISELQKRRTSYRTGQQGKKN